VSYFFILLVITLMEQKMTKLSAADLMVITDVLHRSLRVVGNSKWTEETRERTMEKVILIMEQMDAEVVCGDVEPIVVSGDVGG
jgi:hypothetical protein